MGTNGSLIAMNDLFQMIFEDIVNVLRMLVLIFLVIVKLGV